MKLVKNSAKSLLLLLEEYGSDAYGLEQQELHNHAFVAYGLERQRLLRANSDACEATLGRFASWMNVQLFQCL